MKALLGLAVSLFVTATIVPAFADDAVKLFKIVTAKDDVTIGLTAAELHALGSGPDIDNLAKHLAADGQITVWQYAVRHGQNGTLEQGPLRRVAIFKTDTLRIEPYSTPYAIVAPEK
jgi:hypothetical protein